MKQELKQYKRFCEKISLRSWEIRERVCMTMEMITWTVRCYCQEKV